MTRHITDDDSRLIIKTYYDQIENAIKTARSHMDDECGDSPEVVRRMFELIERLAARGQQFTWPDPVNQAQAARQDAALQQLLKRASKPTPIRAGRALKGAK